MLLRQYGLGAKFVTPGSTFVAAAVASSRRLGLIHNIWSFLELFLPKVLSPNVGLRGAHRHIALQTVFPSGDMQLSGTVSCNYNKDAIGRVVSSFSIIGASWSD